MKISENIIYIGVNDNNIDIFEGQYKMKNGVTYNSYLIKDEKNTVIDTVDKRATEEWLKNIEKSLGGESLDYLIISHMEPDHSSSIKVLAERYPNMKLVGNQKTFAFLPQFFEIENLESRQIVVKEGDTLSLGNHSIKFAMLPMVHWPEVMVEYEETEKVLFSADAFGKFGVVSDDTQETIEEINIITKEEQWIDEARRYYINIVGKYGVQVQAALNKLKDLDIKIICPLHGPILSENLEYYIEKYNTWSKYEAENDGILLVSTSMHGNTFEAMQELEKNLKNNSEKEIKLVDLTREDMTEIVAQAFKYKTLILAAPTYNAELFPTMENFIRLLKAKGYQNRKVALIENGTWAPMAAKLMTDILSQMKNIELITPIVTIRTKMNEETKEELLNLAKELIK